MKSLFSLLVSIMNYDIEAEINENCDLNLSVIKQILKLFVKSI